MWAIIGGSGFEKFDTVEAIVDLERETPFGQASSGLKKIRIGARECLFLPRHGEHHEMNPSEVNYRANIFALKRHGATRILSISAIGSLERMLAPGDLVIPNQYIDRTKGIRSVSFSGNGVVGHVSLAKPVCPYHTGLVRKRQHEFDFKLHFDKTYVCIEGPYFSTQAESNTYRAMGAHIIGMSNFPEYALAREAGLCYFPCCFVTDYDCWDDSIPHVTIAEVIELMRKNNGKAFQLVQTLLADGDDTVAADCHCRENGLKNGLMTPMEAIPEPVKDLLAVLLS